MQPIKAVSSYLKNSKYQLVMRTICFLSVDHARNSTIMEGEHR